MNDKLDLLLKSKEKSKTSYYNDNIRIIHNICTGLARTTLDYKPERGLADIKRYLKLDTSRLFYSEISSFIYSLSENDKTQYLTNLDILIDYIYSDMSEADDMCREFVSRLYDHSQLAIRQTENVNDVFSDNINDIKIELKDTSRGIEKEYIAILGIFASIVLAFVGGITFSTSVLSNIHKASIYRLVGIVDLLAFVLTNTIYMLLRFILEINNKGENNTDPLKKRIIVLNIAYIVTIISTFAAWVFFTYFYH